MRPSLPLAHRPLPGAPTQITARPAFAATGLPPGFQAVHAKGNLPTSVMQRLADRQPRAAPMQQRAGALGLIEDYLATPSAGVAPGGAMRV